ncbi:MAG: PAS domain-containing protein [Gammaproteobacteria bacterium]|nr:PAS domain-containing protein [Gammaproteobacteria bacterium]
MSEINELKDRITFLEEKLYFLQNIVDNLPASLYWKNRQGVYKWCNKYVAAMAGLTSIDEVIGKTDGELPWFEYAEELAEIDKRIIMNNKIEELEETPVLHDNKKRVFLTRKSPLINKEKKAVGIFGVSIDITKQKEGELAKSEFIQNMSHDLRTPLTGLLGISEGQVSSLPDRHPLKQSFLLICQSARQLHRLFEAVLETMKLDYRQGMTSF